MLRRNCCLSPRQLGWAYAGLASVSLLIASAFALQGAWLVLLFALAECLALAVAFLVYARHATDFERIVVDAQHVLVEVSVGGKIDRAVLPRGLVRLHSTVSRRELVVLLAGSRRLEIGRFVRPDRRPVLRDELNAALRWIPV